jgi:threonylcarbamoyladenosine tRNA methylthiotransferase MtaB
MARKTTPGAFASLVVTARKLIPDIAITTDIITGFPGETEVEFLDSLAFVEQLNFAGGHVFSYSAREGTAAAQMANQVQYAERKRRNARMRAVFAESALKYQLKFIGKKVLALWESALELGPEQWKMTGLTDNYLRVRAEAPRKYWNQITPVQVTGITDEGLYATFDDG